MSRSLLKKAKSLRKQENAKKKANKKNIAGILIFVFIVAAVTAYLLVPGLLGKKSGASNGESEIYSYGRQIVQLNNNGTFNASLAHSVNKSGTYTKKTEGSRTIVTFIVDGKPEIGIIENNSLHLPREWDDGHGHGSVFPRAGSPQSQNRGHDH